MILLPETHTYTNYERTKGLYRRKNLFDVGNTWADKILLMKFVLEMTEIISSSDSYTFCGRESNRIKCNRLVIEKWLSAPFLHRVIMKEGKVFFLCSRDGKAFEVFCLGLLTFLTFWRQLTSRRKSSQLSCGYLKAHILVV